MELWFLNAFPGVNSELSVMIMPMGKPYTKSELGWVMSEQFSDIVFQQAPSFKVLTLNRTIMALWRTIVLLSAGELTLLSNVLSSLGTEDISTTNWSR